MTGAWALVPSTPWPPDRIGLGGWHQAQASGHGWDVRAACAGPASATQKRGSSDRYWTARVQRYHDEQLVRA